MENHNCKFIIFSSSYSELIKTFQRVNGVKIPHKFVDRRPGDYPYLVADNSLAK